MAAAVAVVLTAVIGSTAISAVADPLDSPAQLLNPTLLQFTEGGRFSATPAQAVSLGHLQGLAVQKAVADHGLDASDGTAAQTWGRDAAEMELWGLLVEAITTPSASRTTDQSNAVAWLQSVVARELLNQVKKAGTEFAKWAGLGADAFEALVDEPGVTKAELTEFLEQTPQNYGVGYSIDSPQSTSNEGYCVYTSPTSDTHKVYEHSIYADGLGENTASPDCYTPCPLALGCKVEPPTIDDLMEWGVFDSLQPVLSQESFGAAVLGMAKQFDFTAAAPMGAALPTGSDAGPVVGDDVVAKRIEELTKGYLPGVPPAVGAALDIAEKIAGLIEIFGVELPGVGEALSVLAVALEIYNFVIEDAVPGQLAKAIYDAKNTPPDLSQMLDDGQGGVIFDLFVAATLPLPLNRSCANFVGDVPCLNAPAVVPSLNATTLTVTPRATGKAQAATSVTWRDQAAKISNQAYFVGNWAVDTATADADPATTVTYQTLDFGYTDWSGVEHTAWIVPSGSSGYRFFTAQTSATGFAPSTCDATNLCALTNSIEMVGADGAQFALGVPIGNGAPPIPGSPCAAAGQVCLDTGILGVSAVPSTGEVNHPIVLRASFLPRCGNCLGFTAVGTMSFVEVIAQHGTPLCSAVPVASDGSATCTWTPGSSGGRDVYATFTPGANSGEPSAQAVTFVSVGARASTATSLAASDAQAALNTPITYTATVSDVYSDDNAVPAGAVTFSSQGVDLCSDVPVTAGTAACVAHFAAAGSQQVVAIYGGDVATTPSSGTTVTKVLPGAPVVHLQPVAGFVYGKTSSLHITVTAAGAPAAAINGNVTITDGDDPVCSVGVVSGARDCSFTPRNVGSRTLTAGFSGDFLGDVVFSSLGGFTGTTDIAVSVGRAPMTITASSETLPYGSSPQPVTASYEGLVNGDTAASLTTQPTCSTAPVGAGVGSYPTTCSGAADPNYDIAYVSGSLTVTQAPLSITASSQSAVYGSAPRAVTPSYEGFVNGDTAASLTTEPTCSTAAAADSNVGTYPATCSGAAGANYSIEYVAGTVSVTAAPLHVTASSESSVYGTPPAPITASYLGFVNGDTPSALTTLPDCTTQADATSLPGEYPSVCDGAVAANYAIDYLDGIVTVLRAPTQLSVSAVRASGAFTAMLTRSDSGAAIAGARVTFSGWDGVAVCSAETGADGIATCTARDSARRFITLGYSAMYAGDAMYSPATATAGTHSRIPL